MIFAQTNKISDLKFTDVSVMLNDDLSKLQDLLDRLDDDVALFEMHLAFLKRKMLLQYWIVSGSNIVLAQGGIG